MIGIAGFMIVWWLEGNIPLGVTGLLPIVLLPLFHISNGSKTSQIYLTDSNIICFGSLIMAAAIGIILILLIL
jgi:sodium-dependent dicarboxylate transporter 2/3/5